MPAAGWFPDPYGGEKQRYWDGENWTEHVHPPDTADPPDAAAAAADDNEQNEGGAEAKDENGSESWIPRHWRSVAVGVLVFCVGGAVGAAAAPDDTKTVQRTQTIQGAPKVRTVTQTQTQTVKAPAANPSSGPSVAGAAASSPAPSGGGTASTECDPSYAPICLDPTVSDYDCAGGEGDGPKYVDGPVTVVGNDHWELDEADNDGLGCE